MKHIRGFLICFLFLQCLSLTGFAQQSPPFFNEIETFKKQDAINPPPKNAIVFVGSSSFRGWTNVQSYFPGYTIINRGFGGSSLPDAIRYAQDIIIAYQPKQVVIYCGENDFTAEGVNADIVFDRFTTLFEIIRKDLPKAHVVFVSLKPSPSRLKFLPEMVKTNAMIKEYLKQYRRTGYVDVYSKMLLADGTPMPDIFKADKLHMTEAGYVIWQKAIKPYLKK
ncbi:GDSL-type esterase/lipase family protein [Daejeonella lutea]|uniref:Lysophospholipase L1 n=1 Tax=Daejeonella lutea TaxID=572036 RepID=A0A1T5AHS1_9SPHI|nr:GDSL-type esterase/lipase family protein [Daejeonella lutea]SKB34496.1 Lysophospholipase L1 [Daejeonella lutea]